MNVNFLEIAHNLFSVQLRVVYLLGVLFLGLFLFWRSTRRLHMKEAKSRDLIDSCRLFRVGGLFDLIFLCLIFAVLLSRILYIMHMPDVFSGARWFLLPYEKIESNVHIMASFPWLFFRLWDGGLLVDGFILGLTSAFFFFSRFYSLRWSSVGNAVADFFWLVFMSAEIFFAVCSKSLVHLGIFVALLLTGGVRFFANKYAGGKGNQWFTDVVEIVWKMVAFMGPALGILWWRLSSNEVQGKEFLIAVDATAVAIAFWMCAAHVWGVFYDVKLKPGKVKVSELSENSPGGELRKRAASETVKVRSFAMSYKDFSGGWAEKIQGIGRLFRKRKDVQDEKGESGV